MENKHAKRKIDWRLNLFDILFIAGVLLIAGLIIGYLGFSGGIFTSSGSRETIHYTIELRGMLDDTAWLPKPGDELIDRIEKRPLGTVVSAEVKPSPSIQKDMFTEQQIMSYWPDRNDAVLVIKAEANVTESRIRIGNFTVRVGTWISVNGPFYTGNGFVIDIERSDDA